MGGFWDELNKTHLWIAVVVVLIIFLIYYFSKDDSIEPLLDELRKLQKKLTSK